MCMGQKQETCLSKTVHVWWNLILKENSGLPAVAVFCFQYLRKKQIITSVYCSQLLKSVRLFRGNNMEGDSEKEGCRKEWVNTIRQGGEEDDKEDVSTASLHFRVFDYHVMIAAASQTFMFTESYKDTCLSLSSSVMTYYKLSYVPWPVPCCCNQSLNSKALLFFKVNPKIVTMWNSATH